MGRGGKERRGGKGGKREVGDGEKVKKTEGREGDGKSWRWG
jgi:hypothetical protein